MIVPKIYRIQLSLFMRTESNKSDLNYRHDVVNKTYLFYKKKNLENGNLRFAFEGITIHSTKFKLIPIFTILIDRKFSILHPEWDA